MEEEESSGGGFQMRGQERVVFKQPEKSRLGLDALALAKRNESKLNGTFKAPRERINSVAASFDEEEKPTVTDVDKDGVVAHEVGKRRPNRRYRETALSETPETESTVVQDDKDYNRFDTRHSNRSVRSEVYSRHDKDGYEDYSTSERNRGTPRREHERYDRRSSGKRYVRDSSSRRNDRDYSGEYDRKRSRYEEPRTPGRSDWDDGRWDGRKLHVVMVTKLLAGVINLHHLLCWLGCLLTRDWFLLGKHLVREFIPLGNSPPLSPVPIRASGSVRSSNSQYKKDVLLDLDADESAVASEHNPEITENYVFRNGILFRLCMYDREEGSTVYDADSSSFYLGDDTTHQNKEVELAKRLMRSDGTMMSHAQSKKHLQLSVDKQQWEDHQLMRSVAV